MMQALFEAAKRQRLAWSCAIIAALFLTVYGHAPALPVIAGCLLAVGIAMLRALPGPASRGSK